MAKRKNSKLSSFSTKKIKKESVSAETPSFQLYSKSLIILGFQQKTLRCFLCF